MNNTMKMIGVSASIFTLGALSACASSQPQVVEYGADYPTYGSMSELCAAATVVIRGEMVDQTVQEVQLTPIEGGSEEEDPSLNAPEDAPAPETPTVVKTITTVAVTEVLNGSGIAPGDEIEVGQLGGTLENVRYEAERYSMQAETPYVMFLETYPNAPANLLNPTQAGYQVSEQNTLVAGNDNPIARASAPLAADASLCAAS